MRRGLSLWVCLALLSGSVHADKARQRDRTWVVQQLARWDLSRREPFRLTARLEVLDGNGSLVAGTYTLSWASAERWREEVVLGGYHEVGGLRGTSRWWQRPTRYRPRLAWLLTAPIRSDAPRAESGEFHRTHARKGMTALACIGQACVDAETGEVRTIELNLATGSPGARLLLSFYPVAPFPAGSWPKGFRVLEEGRQIGRLEVTSLEPMAGLLEEEVAPPPEAVVVPGCSAPTPPKIVPASKVKPPYPEALRQSRVEGVARLRATVTADGSVRGIEPSWAAHPLLNELAIESLRQWRYEPARCGGVPVPVEMWLQVEWRLE